MTGSARPILTDAQRSGLRLLAGAGAAAFAAGCALCAPRAWGDLLAGNFFFVSLSLAAAVFIAIQNLSSAGWSVVFRRVPEAMTAYLPAGAVLTALVLAGARWLYPWAAAGAAAPTRGAAAPTWGAAAPTWGAAEALAGKAAYLGVWSMAARAAVCWAVWLWFVGRIVALSRAGSAEGAVERTRGAKALSAAFLVCFGPTFSVCSVDWLMSLEPRWYSTIYPWYVFAGAFESAFAALAVLLVWLRRNGALAQVNDHHLHDVGKLLFAFSAFWAYLWFSQFLLIWYSNIPEETTFYVRRLSSGPWAALFWLNPVVNFAAPFALLLPARRKKSARTLLAAGALLLAGHGLDLYTLALPAVSGEGPRLGALEALIFAGLAAVYALLFERAFASAESVPVHDPYLQESLRFEGV